MSDKKGFSGLNELGADIDDIIKNHNSDKAPKEKEEEAFQPKKTDKGTEQKRKNTNTSSAKKSTSTAPDTDGSEGPANWSWWLLGIIGIIIWIVIQNNNSSFSNQTTYSSSSQAPTATDSSYESKPETYTDVLNKNQLLYCEAEQIRLDAVKGKINTYSSYEINKYNNLSNDYNSRCADKQYYKNDMPFVQRSIRSKKYELEQEGLARFNKSKNINHKSIQKYRLTVTVNPLNSRIRIMNIQPKYHDGILLKQGKYRINITKSGYKKYDKWINLNSDKQLTINLEKVNISQQSYTGNKPSYNFSDKQVSLAKEKCRDYSRTVNRYKRCVKKELKKFVPSTARDFNLKYPNILPLSSKSNSSSKQQTTYVTKVNSSKPNMSNLSSSERQSIESTCGWRKSINGPTDYYQCIQKHVTQLSY